MKRDIVGCQVLDIACGEGITTNKIFSLTGLPEKYIGVDIVESYNQHVAQLFKRAGCETTIGITEDLTEESFLSNPFWERDRDRNLQLTGFIFGGWLYNYDKNFRLNFLRHFHEKLQPGDCLYIFGDNTQNKTTVELAYADKNFSTWLVNGLDFSFHVLKYTGLDPSWIEYWPHVESTDDGLVSCMDMYNLGIQHLEQGHPVIQGMPDTPGNPLFIIYPGEKIIGGRAYKLREDACVQEHEQTGWQVDQLSFSRVRHPRFAEREINASLWRLERR
jgi:SAM-dependent methyltransferase